MANAWKKDKSIKLTTPKTLFLIISTSFIILTFFYLSSSNPNPYPNPNPNSALQFNFPIEPYNCYKSPQSHPIIANLVENVKYPFLFSLSDFGSLPDKPHKNIVRLLKGKLFRRPDISVTIQEVLEKMKSEGKMGVFVDVGANVGMATFAAAVMGFRVFAFEPVLENLQSICNGIYFNRVDNLVHVFEAATSDRLGNITFHKVVGRLDNSAVSATGAKLAFKSNEEIALQVRSIPLDLIIPENEPVLLVKIDVQGWEYHVLKGAKKLLSRKKGEAPYLIYEEDERLLQASNTSSKEIRRFLHGLGYTNCVQQGTKELSLLLLIQGFIVLKNRCILGLPEKKCAYCLQALHSFYVHTDCHNKSSIWSEFRGVNGVTAIKAGNWFDRSGTNRTIAERIIRNATILKSGPGAERIKARVGGMLDDKDLITSVEPSS